MKKPELLAPAGDMACLKAAINAGADAVYLGGEEYGARAYASNFSSEELCEAVSYAHLFGVKLYLTVNTLIKEREFAHLTEFIKPVYEAGLDGVIVQDLGALKKIKETFPKLSLHASTQMCITNSYGAELLKNYGVSRIVPARELSLSELRKIKKEVDIEIECFIHGAMCYSYSGQCLFSSFLGGRSGNRGRCAGPCRLPYEVFGKTDCYPLSLKDMCTVSMLGDLMEAEIDSFKIEGRMKNPYYVAGVTAIYRKYIDDYLRADTKGVSVQMEKRDMDILQNLYIRTELQNGYFYRHNGKEMITMQKPGYVSATEDMFSDIRDKYLTKDRKLPITGELTVKKGAPLILKIYDEQKHETIVFGEEIVTEAVKSPVSSEEIQKQMNKTGNTAFYFTSFSVIMDDNVFVSLKSLGEIRRKALDDFKENLTAEKRRNCDWTTEASEMTENNDALVMKNQPGFRISCSSIPQLVCVAEFVKNHTEKHKVNGIEISAFLLKELDDTIKKDLFVLKNMGIGIFLILPPVFRKKSYDWLKEYETLIFSDLFDGYYCNGIDSLAYIKSHVSGKKKQIIADYALYMCNFEAVAFLKEQGADGFVVPYELSDYEWLDLRKRLFADCMTPMYQEYMVYGQIPFMQTANCVKKTFDRCDHKNQVITLKDRMSKDIYVVSHCEICENTVYNGIPLSLHKEIDRILADNFRLCFTIESPKETLYILEAFINHQDVRLKEFTKGHFKKGIE